MVVETATKCSTQSCRHQEESRRSKNYRGHQNKDINTSEVFLSIGVAATGLFLGYVSVIGLDRSPRIRRRIMPTITAILTPKVAYKKQKKLLAVCSMDAPTKQKSLETDMLSFDYGLCTHIGKRQHNQDGVLVPSAPGTLNGYGKNGKIR